jgi:hypothetical protein
LLKPIPTIRAAALTLMVAIAGCSAAGTSGGSAASFVPAQSGALAAATAPSSTLCTAKGTGYAFKGACAETTLKSRTGGALALAAYKGRTLQAVFGKNTGAATFAFALHDATGLKDITGKVGGKSFPAFYEFPVLVYLDAHNAGSSAAVFSSTPKLTFALSTTLGMAGGDCGAAELADGIWKLVPGLYASVSPAGTALVLPAKNLAAAFKITVPANGDAYLLVYCEGY